jgi:hypothetical protein
LVNWYIFFNLGSQNFFFYKTVTTINKTECSLQKFDYEKKEGVDVLTFAQLTKHKISCSTPFSISKGDKYAVFKIDSEKVFFI